MKTNGIQINDIFYNTEGFGDCVVKDVYISPTSQERCYEIALIENGEETGKTFVCRGVELQ